MTISTEESNFNDDAAEALLKGIKKQELKTAHTALKTSYLSKVEGKNKPGRMYRYSET